jgi:hypothetical protein
VALEFATDRPELAERVLTRVGRLDALLDGQTSAEPSAALRDRIVASAPSPRAAGRAWRWLVGAGLGAGLAAACACGVAVGMTLAPHSVTRMISGPAPAAEPADGLTALLNPPTDPAGA